ncbi:hypothetical protein ABT133_10425, partial [Streptomyces sp. NPDC001835]
KDKRASTIDRIAIAIGRTSTRPTGLDTLAACTLNTGAAADNGSGAGNGNGNGNNGQASGNDGAQAGGATAAGTISCPDVASRLPAVPASAKAEVDRNLTLLQTQIQEANTRLARTVGQGGPDFVNNAILGPLKDKRASTIDRIAIAIGRTSTRPTGLDTLAACTLTK